VAFPSFLAYAISGNLIFGRRMEVFATVQAAFATCFRIVMECEYDWDTLSADYFWTTALWIWTFIVLNVLILLNMPERGLGANRRLDTKRRQSVGMCCI